MLPKLLATQVGCCSAAALHCTQARQHPSLCPRSIPCKTEFKQLFLQELEMWPKQGAEQPFCEPYTPMWTRDPKLNVLAMTDKQPKRCECSRRQREKKKHLGLGGSACSVLTESPQLAPAQGPAALPTCHPQEMASFPVPPSSKLGGQQPLPDSQTMSTTPSQHMHAESWADP